MVSRSSTLIHWIGFLATCFMLVAALLDQSRDEFLIHFIASMIPNTSCWAVACLLGGSRNLLPFLGRDRSTRR